MKSREDLKDDKWPENFGPPIKHKDWYRDSGKLSKSLTHDHIA